LIVVDASVMIEVLLKLPAASRISRRVFAPGETLHAPHVFDVEIAQVVRRFERLGGISADRGAEALADLADLPLKRYPHFALLPRI